MKKNNLVFPLKKPFRFLPAARAKRYRLFIELGFATAASCRRYSVRRTERDLSPNENGGPFEAPADRVLPHQTAISCYQILSSLRGPAVRRALDQFAILTTQTTRGGFFSSRRNLPSCSTYTIFVRT